MRALALFLVLPSAHTLLVVPMTSHQHLRASPPVASLVKKTSSVARPVLVPALSYGGLAAVAVGATKVVASAGYASAAIMGMPLPVAAAVAVLAPALVTFFEFTLFGGGKRIAQAMGGTPADPRLTALVGDVARRAGLKPPAHVFEIPTGELNAFAAGFGTDDATVAITAGLRSKLTSRELEAVLAHEIGHIRHADMRTSMHVMVAIAGLGGIYEMGRVLANSEMGSRASSSDDDDDGGSVVPLGLAMYLGHPMGPHLSSTRHGIPPYGTTPRALTSQDDGGPRRALCGAPAPALDEPQRRVRRRQCGCRALRQ